MVNSVKEAFIKFQPYLQEYYNLLINESLEPASQNGENRRQRFCNNINDMLHLMGHLFHNLSDLHINLRDISPRSIHTMIPFQTAIISTIPHDLSTGNLSNSSNSGLPSTTTATNNNNNNDSNSNVNLNNQSSFVTSQIINNSNNNNNSNILNGNLNVHGLLPFVHPTSLIFQAPNLNTNLTQRPTAQQTTQEIINPSTTTEQFSIPNNSMNSSNPASNLNRQLRNTRLQPSQISGDPYLLCNSVHFFNSSVNNVLSSVTNFNNSTPVNQRINISNNTTQRRRHPAGNQNSSDNNESNNLSFNGFSRIVGDIITPIVQSDLSNNTAEIQTNSPNANRNNIAVRINADFTQPSSRDNTSNLENENNINILNGILSAVNNIDPNNEQLLPVNELINLLRSTSGGVTNSTSSNSILLNVFNIIFSNMSLQDMLNLAMHQDLNEVFNKSKSQLQNYIENILKNDDNINYEVNETKLIDKLYEDLLENMMINFNDLKLKDSSIDFKLSFQSLTKDHFKILIKHVLTGEIADWGMKFYDKLKNFRDEIIILSRCCLENADEQIVNLIYRKLESIIINSNNHQRLRSYLLNNLKNQLLEIISSIHIDKKKIEKYIISNENKFNVEMKSSDTNITKNLNIEKDAGISYDVNNILPVEWVPIVLSDIKLQSTSKLRYNFSDAYSSGMPPKRRKIIRKHDLCQQNWFKNVIKRTFLQMNYQGDTNELLLDSINNKKFLNLVSALFDKMLLNRLERDFDFINICKKASKLEENKYSNKRIDCFLKKSSKSIMERLCYTRKRFQ